MIRLTFRQLEYFEALAETLHFGRAADLVGVTQPALSTQIAEMEEKLACRLFERGTKSVRLTREAEELRPRVGKILSEIRDIEAGASRGRPLMGGRFRLGIIPTVAPYLLPRILPVLRDRFPGLQVELREAVTATLVHETGIGKLDAFVAALPIEAPGLVCNRLFDDRFLLAVPSGDPAFVSPPVPPESPELERLMLLEEGHCLRDQALALCGSVKPAAMARYGATSLTTLLQMVSHGMGITLLPEMATKAGLELRGLKLVRFAEPQPQRTICLAWRKTTPRSAEIEMLADLIKEAGSPEAAEPSRRPDGGQERLITQA